MKRKTIKWWPIKWLSKKETSKMFPPHRKGELSLGKIKFITLYSGSAIVRWDRDKIKKVKHEKTKNCISRK